MKNRIIKKALQKQFFQGKAIILVGARQVGKTTLTQDLISKKDTLFFNCDNPSERESLNEKDLDYLEKIIDSKKIIFIDEGQKVKSIGQTVKLLVDRFKKEKQIIITGSSSMNLLDQTAEALTGRKIVFNLFPLSLEELFPKKNPLEISKNLESLLIFGSYPEVINQKSFDKKRNILEELSSSNLYKDILEFQQIRNSAVIFNLLKALAFQVGSEVSYNELSNTIGIDKKTVEKYIDLLEKNYILFRLPPYYKNKRKEISQSKKIYFYDLGIRNAIINNFNLLDFRDDIGALWENFIINERLKYQSYHKIYSNNYFWRTYTGVEVDWIEEHDGKLFGFEFKFNPKKKIKAPASWLETYPESSWKLINKENFTDFIA
ncbi:MAG: ATP-binding protein [bacterium]|nr:ATP-binding protein [bacterium]